MSAGRVIVGTAGHIDHGKTSLVKALTGIDCDRWAEEKARGITIDIGFAHLREGDFQVGFVDVPGHERFLHNALAGLGGIRIALLVVAADEGVKPQTREHLAVCVLLGIPACLVALTKTDLVAPDLVELAELEVEELLAGTPYAKAAVFPVSSETGAGIPELRAALVATAEQVQRTVDPARLAGLPARLPVDRAFHLKGLGVVATGTLAAGTVRAGDVLEVLPGGVEGLTARVRSIQVHGEPREAAEAGERTSLQLSGVALEQLRRGLQLGTPDAFAAGNSLLARFRLLPEAPAPIRGFVPVRLHLYASEVVGRLRPLPREAGDEAVLEPGESGLVEIRLAAPVAAVRGDRFVVRRPSPAATLGGGEILDPRWRRHRGRVLPTALAALAGDLPAALTFWALEAGERGIEAPEAARRLGCGAPEAAESLHALATRKEVTERLLEVPEGPGHGRRWLAPAAFQRVEERARRVLKEYFQKDRLALGIPKAEAVRRIVRGRGAELADVYFAWLAARKVLAVQGDQVTLPGRGSQLTGEESKLSTALLAQFEAAGLAPPSPGDLQQALGAKPQILDGVVRHLVARGQLVRLPGGLILAASALTELRRQLAGTAWERFSVADFKDRFGLTRKWAIPLLEHLDSTGATRRVGDERLVVR
jgi:selenocysteine-specific elongation factor